VIIQQPALGRAPTVPRAAGQGSALGDALRRGGGGVQQWGRLQMMRIRVKHIREDAELADSIH